MSTCSVSRSPMTTSVLAVTVSPETRGLNTRPASVARAQCRHARTKAGDRSTRDPRTGRASVPGGFDAFSDHATVQMIVHQGHRPQVLPRDLPGTRTGVGLEPPDVGCERPELVDQIAATLRVVDRALDLA